MKPSSPNSLSIPVPQPDRAYKFSPEEWDMFVIFLSHLAIQNNQNFLKLYSREEKFVDENREKLQDCLLKAMRVIPSHAYYFI